MAKTHTDTQSWQSFGSYLGTLQIVLFLKKKKAIWQHGVNYKALDKFNPDMLVLANYPEKSLNTICTNVHFCFTLSRKTLDSI